MLKTAWHSDHSTRLYQIFCLHFASLDVAAISSWGSFVPEHWTGGSSFRHVFGLEFGRPKIPHVPVGGPMDPWSLDLKKETWISKAKNLQLWDLALVKPQFLVRLDLSLRDVVGTSAKMFDILFLQWGIWSLSRAADRIVSICFNTPFLDHMLNVLITALAVALPVASQTPGVCIEILWFLWARGGGVSPASLYFTIV